MSEFQAQLDDELEKRDLDNPESDGYPTRLKQARFSFKTFFIGLILGSFVLGGLMGWAHLSANDIMAETQKRLPSKTAVVTVIESKTYRIGDNQPVLRMPDAPQEITEQIETNHENANDTKDRTAPTVSQEEKAITAMIEENTKPSPFQTYKQPFIKIKNKPALSIIVTNLGLSAKATEDVIKNFPKEISIAFSPYTENLDLLTSTAREKGHEIWVMLPSETASYPLIDPGPFTLLTSGSVEQNNDRINKVLSSGTGFVGLIPEKNHIFKEEDTNINPAIKSIFKEGFALLDSATSGQSFVSKIAYKNDYPHGSNNFWLDDSLTPLALNQRIRQMIEFGEASGSVTVMLRPYPVSLKAIQKFIGSSAAQKFQLVPASALIKNSG